MLYTFYNIIMAHMAGKEERMSPCGSLQVSGHCSIMYSPQGSVLHYSVSRKPL